MIARLLECLRSALGIVSPSRVYAAAFEAMRAETETLEVDLVEPSRTLHDYDELQGLSDAMLRTLALHPYPALARWAVHELGLRAAQCRTYIPAAKIGDEK